MEHGMKPSRVAAFIAMFIMMFSCSNPVNDVGKQKTVTLLSIPGVIAPVFGEIPLCSEIETSQYFGTIEWNPATSAFERSTEYSAVIELTAKEGWTFRGVPAGSFQVEGATTANAQDSGTVLAVFPATGNGDYFSPIVGLLKYVPAGSFQRDTTATNISVISAPFRMSQFEITREQFSLVMGVDPSNTGFSNVMTDPVQQVNWYQAIAFCNKISLAEGFAPVYSVVSGGVTIDWDTLTFNRIPKAISADWDAVVCNWDADGYRLPSEMEWMWAAMGADSGLVGARNLTGFSKLFSGSTGTNSVVDFAWYNMNSEGRIHPVGMKPANELGLFDLSGNVSEWCWDRFAYYPIGIVASDTDSGRGGDSGYQRIVRGGNFNYNAGFCCIASRYFCSANVQVYNFGFRIVRN